MIREAQFNDIQNINNLYLILFGLMQQYEPDYMKASHQDEDFLKSVVAQENNLIAFVYEADNTVKGFAIAQMQETLPYNCLIPLKCIYLIDIVVDENSRGLGIGKALIDKVKEWGACNGSDYIELKVLTANKAAIELYEREGLTSFSISMWMKMK